MIAATGRGMSATVACAADNRSLASGRRRRQALRERSERGGMLVTTSMVMRAHLTGPDHAAVVEKSNEIMRAAIAQMAAAANRVKSRW